MLIVTKKINLIFDKKGLNIYKLAKQIDYHIPSLYKMMNGEKPLPEHLIEKMAPIFEVSVNEIKSWILADKYSKEILELALAAKKNIKVPKGKLILTIKIDEILQSKDMSRTALSKEIKYSQSGLNRMIIGDESLSKSVKERIALILQVSEDEITSWVVADKYELEVIELALRELENQV